MIRARLTIAVFLLLMSNSFSSVCQKVTTGDYRVIYTVADTAAVLKKIEDAQTLGRTHPDSAMAILRNAIEESRSINFRYGELLAIYKLAWGHAYASQSNEAIINFIYLMMRCSSPQEKRYIAPAIIGIGSIKSQTGRYDDAFRYYALAYKAMNVYGSRDHFSYSSILNNQASILIMLHRTSSAIEYLQKAELAALKEKNYRLLTHVYTNLGAAYTIDKKYIKAEGFLKKALNMALIYGKGSNEHAQVLVAFGTLYNTQQQPLKSLSYLKQASTLNDELSERLLLNLWGNMGVAWGQLEDYQKAADIGEKILQEALKTGNLQVITDTYYNLAQIHIRKKRYKDALKYSWLYFQYSDSMQGAKVRNNISNIESKYQNEVKDKEIAIKELRFAQQNKKLISKNNWIIFISSASLVLIMFMFIIRRNYKQRINLLQKEQQISWLKAIMKGEEQERVRIGRELHDGIGGMLAAVKMNMSAISDYPTEEMRSAGYDEVVKLLDNTSQEVRKTAHNLMPDMLLRYGLFEMLKQYCENINLNKKLHLDLQLRGDIKEVNTSAQLSIYRILQELIQNIVKHSMASHALIQVTNQDKIISILVEDNGKGIDSSTTKDGIGFLNIHSRVHSLNGTISIKSEVGKGTLVYIEFNLSETSLVS